MHAHPLGVPICTGGPPKWVKNGRFYACMHGLATPGARYVRFGLGWAPPGGPMHKRFVRDTDRGATYADVSDTKPLCMATPWVYPFVRADPQKGSKMTTFMHRNQ